MFKKRYHSVDHNFKTGFLCKFTLFIGIFLLIIFLIITTLSFFANNESTGFLKSIYDISNSQTPESIVALSMIFIFVGIILYFLSCQFAKLSDIAHDIETNEEYIDEDFKEKK